MVMVHTKKKKKKGKFCSFAAAGVLAAFCLGDILQNLPTLHSILSVLFHVNPEKPFLFVLNISHTHHFFSLYLLSQLFCL